jgi:hypothetical protein
VELATGIGGRDAAALLMLSIASSGCNGVEAVPAAEGAEVATPVAA